MIDRRREDSRLGEGLFFSSLWFYIVFHGIRTNAELCSYTFRTQGYVVKFEKLSVFLMLIWGLIISTTSASVAQRRLIGMDVSEMTINVDGRLDEPAWMKAKLGQGMTERTPNPGTPSPMAFQVRVLFDEDALYFGLESSLEPGEAPRSVELRRDTFNIFSGDTFTIKLDVHHDKVTTIGFAFNAAGAQTDYMAMTGGGGFRREFDAVWETASVVTRDQWVAEVRIPFAAIGIPKMDADRVVGLNITRDHNARLATYDWSPLPPELGAVAATHYGELHGLRYTGSTGRAVRFIPYALAQSPGTGGLADEHLDLKSGFDLRVSLTKDLWGEATVFTDFAEVDLDDALVNLSRFPLFLPEKRPFFLSGLDVFAFGDSSAYQLFYSRRIGLDGSGNAIPIWGGLKVHGRVGRLSVGGLSVTTDKRGDLEQSQHTVLRLRQDFGGRGTLGAMFTNRISLAEDGNQLAHNSLGLDWTYRFLDNRLQLSAFSALTLNEQRLVSGSEQNGCKLELAEVGMPSSTQQVLGSSTRLRAQYKGPNMTSFTQIRQVGCHFDPEMGFARRTDIRTLRQGNGYTWRGVNGLLTRFYVGHDSGLTLDDQSNRYLGLSSYGLLSAVLLNRFEAEISAGYAEDVVDESFELPNGRVVDSGTYTGPQAEIELSASRARNPYGAISYGYNGGFYGGQSHSVAGRLGATLGAHLRLSVRLSNTWLVFDDTPTDQTSTLNGDASFAINPRLFVETNIQANTVAETGNLLARLRWRYYPGSDLYLVYQESFDVSYNGGVAAPERIRSKLRTVTLKLTYWHDGVL